jgi:hypothetical protein
MNPRTPLSPLIRTSRLSRQRRRAASRKGVVSVVSMMFLILFGSLAAAMAIMSKGNIITAATHQHVVRAQGAAETGLAIAEQRLAEAVSRFVVEKGTIDGAFGESLWAGSYSSGVTVLPPSSFPTATAGAAGIHDAIGQIHAEDQNTVDVGIGVTSVSAAPYNGPDAALYTGDRVRTPAVSLFPEADPSSPRGISFQIDYALLNNGTTIRVISTGYDFGYQSRGQPITRRITQDFQLAKRVDAAVMSPSRIMIGKNVMIDGELGATFTDTDKQYGDPLIMKSDFWGMDSALDGELTRLFDKLATYDTDKDNRLRIGHSVEGSSLPDYGHLGYNGADVDVTENGYLDEFDVFIMYYDGRNGGARDGRVALGGALTAGTPASAMTAEFVASGGQSIDDQLALLIDTSMPDRNKNGLSSFADSNFNGRYDPGEPLLDFETVESSSVPTSLQSYIVNVSGATIVYRDQVLGFRDGFIDKRDQYAKVRGRLVFKTSESAWIAGQGNYMSRLKGPISPKAGQSPVQFGASSSSLPDLGPASFTNSENALKAAANGGTFEAQVAQNLGVSATQLATWTPANNPAGATAPKYFPLSGDGDNDGMPDNWQTAYFEKMPFNAPTYTDWYYRPVYENMTFRDVRIPEGNNGLFKNCTFIGVTYVRSSPTNGHINWTIYGKMKLNSSGRPTLDPPRYAYTGTSFPQMLSSTDRPVLMATTPLDKADIPDNQIPYTQGYANLPDPLIIDGTRRIDTKKLSNNIRFHSSLFVGSIVSDTPGNYTHARNKLQFTGSTRFTNKHPQYPEDPAKNPDPGDLTEILKSSMMLPNYSVDIGQFNSPPTQDVQLRGAIIAGVLDIRGNASIDGALLLTFRPQLGQIPLLDAMNNPVGNPSLFNASLGYFGPDDGDDESLDPRTLPEVNGQKIVGWDLDGDGLADLPPDQTPSAAQLAAGAVTVPFYGYGGVTLRFDPNMSLPDGILLPMQIDIKHGSYRETSK